MGLLVSIFLSLLLFASSLVAENAIPAYQMNRELYGEVPRLDPEQQRVLRGIEQILNANQRVSEFEHNCEAKPSKKYFLTQARLRKMRDLSDRMESSLRGRRVSAKGLVMQNMQLRQEIRSSVSVDELARRMERDFHKTCGMCKEEAEVVEKQAEIKQLLGLRDQHPCYDSLVSEMVEGSEKPLSNAEIMAKLPEIVFVSENHFTGGSTRKSLYEKALNKEILLVTEHLNDDYEPLALARLLKLDGANANKLIGKAGKPEKRQSHILGLDRNLLSGLRSLQVMQGGLRSFHQVRDWDSTKKKDMSLPHREAFLDMIIGNNLVRNELELILNSASAELREGIAFSEEYPPMEQIMGFNASVEGYATGRSRRHSRIKSIWTGTVRRKEADAIQRMAFGFINASETANRTLMSSDNSSKKHTMWGKSFLELDSENMKRHQIMKMSDRTFYDLVSMLRERLAQQIPQVKSEETIGGLVRDWQFTDVVQNSICKAIKFKTSPIVVNLGAAHTMRVSQMLKNNLGSSYPMRFLQATGPNMKSLTNRGSASDWNPWESISYGQICKGLYPSSRVRFTEGKPAAVETAE